MERKIYQPTEKQNVKFSQSLDVSNMPSDEQFKAQWAKRHHGKTAGWGLEKRQWILSNMTTSREYQLGLWQARADFAQDLDYQNAPLTDENTNAYNLGYYRGWNDGNPFQGLDKNTVARLMSEYGN